MSCWLKQALPVNYNSGQDGMTKGNDGLTVFQWVTNGAPC